MISTHYLFDTLHRVSHFIYEIFLYAATFLKAMVSPKAVLAARLLAVESQLTICRKQIRRKKDPRPHFTPAFRMLWVFLSKVIDGWEDLAQLMQPATVKKWHTRGYRLFWRWKSRPGRPTICLECATFPRWRAA